MYDIIICDDCINCKIRLESSLISNIIYKELESQLKDTRKITTSNNSLIITKCFLARYIINTCFYYCYNNVDKKQACLNALKEMNKENVVNIDDLNNYILKSCQFFFDKSDLINKDFTFLIKNILRK